MYKLLFLGCKFLLLLFLFIIRLKLYKEREREKERMKINYFNYFVNINAFVLFSNNVGI